MTSEIAAIKSEGIEIGYEGAELRAFIKEQQEILRNERAAERRAVKELREMEEREKESERMVAKEMREMEEREKERERQFKLRELELINEQQATSQQQIDSSRRSTLGAQDSYSERARLPKMATFREDKDEIDSFLKRFERQAEARGLKREDWATALSSLLEGKALDVYSRMADDQSNNYDALKIALLQRYEVTEDNFRRRFRTGRPEKGETFPQFVVRQEANFQRWTELAGAEQTYESLLDLLQREQLLDACNKDLRLFLLERQPKNVKEMASLAEQYRTARNVDAASLTSRPMSRSLDYRSPENSKPSQPRVGHVQAESRGGNRREPPTCYNCLQRGHIAKFCRYPKANPTERRSQSQVNRVGCCIKRQEPVIKGACTRYQLSNMCQMDSNARMPVSTGFVGQCLVTVLRDTGCSCVVVRKDKVDSDSLTGDTQTCILADGSSVQSPVARIKVDTPYLVGTVDALCMDNPIYDLIIGNVIDARPPLDPDPEWQSSVMAVETRQQARRKTEPQVPLKVPTIQDVTKEDIMEAQKSDPTLKKIRQLATEGACRETRTGCVEWCIKDDLVYRSFTSKAHGPKCCQLVVPACYRNNVMKIAHEGIMAGHMATKRTQARAMAEFHWPGMQSDIRRYCKSCDICQRTTQKGRVRHVPLQRMPTIDIPFKRVGVDIVGPLSPVTDKGNRYILTLVDYSTRYPEAVALPRIDTEVVAEALLDIFSRIGVPHEMVSDRGSQFTAEMMAELCRLLSMRQLTTTPYHPQCNGLVERFNGTLKQMIRRMCAERPRDWDKYLNAVMFAYREVPNETTGLSPFELVYGRTVRGPLSILKELWTKDVADPEIKNVYQYVMDLRERLESTCRLAQENTNRASRRYKCNYDRRTRQRSLKVGDKVLVLLPTDTNKLLMSWKGPFPIVECVSPVDYRIVMRGKEKTFHINLLKRYMERAEVAVAVVPEVTEDTKDDFKMCELGTVSTGVHIKELRKNEKRQIRNQSTDVLLDKGGKSNLAGNRLESFRPYRFRITAVKGRDNHGADFLSRSIEENVEVQHKVDGLGECAVIALDVANGRTKRVSRSTREKRSDANKRQMFEALTFDKPTLTTDQLPSMPPRNGACTDVCTCDPDMAPESPPLYDDFLYNYIE